MALWAMRHASASLLRAWVPAARCVVLRQPARQGRQMIMVAAGIGMTTTCSLLLKLLLAAPRRCLPPSHDGGRARSRVQVRRKRNMGEEQRRSEAAPTQVIVGWAIVACLSECFSSM